MLDMLRWKVLHYGAEHIEADRMAGKEVVGPASCFVEVERRYSSAALQEYCEREQRADR
jgi:hypothetical protein